jgi:alpha-beta hydrolase superfamily lysophospholipase
MQHYEKTINAKDGLNLYVQGWDPAGEARGVVLIIHGIGEHSGRYTHVAEFLVSNGLSVIAMDHRGHGKSGGPRGHTPSFDAFMDDIDVLFAEASARHPDVHQILYGHSMGGIFVLNYQLRRKPKVNGVISASAAMRTSLEEQTFKVILAKVLGSVLPGVSMTTDLDPADISRDPDVVNRYINDPLVHNKISFGMGKGLLEAIDWAYDHADEFNVPLLLIHGTADKPAYARGSEEFAQHVSDNCTLKLWDGYAHELHNEPEKQEVLDYMLAWIEKTI